MMLVQVALIFILSSISMSVSHRLYGFCPLKNCGNFTFQCFDGTCIHRRKYCNGVFDCSDRSDEDFCAPKQGNIFVSDSCSRSSGFALCPDSHLCIPAEWICDGIQDCGGILNDEINCENNRTKVTSVDSVRNNAIQWIRNKAVRASPTRKWGPMVHKTAVAFFLSYSDFLNQEDPVRKEITYELTIQLLSKLNHKPIQNISSSDLASFINAFLVTCSDPRDFHGHNLVQELRMRIENQNYTNPYTLLTLCNAGDKITESDVRSLTDSFWSDNRELWTGTQAFVVMALSCARRQKDSSVDSDTINELLLELKNRQYKNGTVENLHTTLLTLQALYAAETDEDPDHFDERAALSYVMNNQNSDGSFGNFLLTYYALPVLSCRSLVDINNQHCVKVIKDEDTAIFDLVNFPGPRVRIYYSIWIGIDKDIEKTLTIRVPANISFYGLMEKASEIDSTYKFEFVVKNGKPYINAVSGIFDKPESGEFWFPYTVKDKKPTLLKESTADMIPKDGDHIVMWYRRGNWAEELH